MPITVKTVTKAKVTTKAKQAQLAVKPVLVEDPEPTEMTIEQLADKYGDLQTRVAALMKSPVITEFKLIAEELKTRCKEYEPDEIIKIKGKEYLLDIGACAKEGRKIVDILKVLEFLGQKSFAEIAKVGVEDAQKYLTVDQFEAVVNKPGFTENRKVTVEYLGKKK